jgi:hypothetical protein
LLTSANAVEVALSLREPRLIAQITSSICGAKP